MSSLLIVNALLLGLSVAAPLGPVNLAAIRTGLVRGARAGWMVGLGAAAADTAYLLLVYAGVLPLLARVTWLATILAGGGAALLARMAWHALRSAWSGEAGQGRDAGRAGLPAFWWGVGITAVNPLTIASWLSVGGGFAATYLAGRPGWVAAGALLAVGIGSAAWFSFLAALVAVARPWVAGRGWFLRGVNLVAGATLAWFAGALLLRAFGR